MKQMIVCIGLFGIMCSAYADDNIATLRGEVSIARQSQAPRIEQVEDNDIKRKRNYPMQPPTIPHNIDEYQVDLFTNKCLSCHSRRRAEQSGASMVSVTHYVDRNGNFLAEMSPRRYFCNQCHVTQVETGPLVENTFEDVDLILRRVGKEL
jgi:cytochrome c-type protein NapB